MATGFICSGLFLPVWRNANYLINCSGIQAYKINKWCELPLQIIHDY